MNARKCSDTRPHSVYKFHINHIDRLTFDRYRSISAELHCIYLLVCNQVALNVLRSTQKQPMFWTPNLTPLSCSHRLTSGLILALPPSE